MKSSKLNIELTEKSREKLENIKVRESVPYGNTINYLIDAFADLPETVKEYLVAVCKPKMRQLQEEITNSKGFKADEIFKQMEAYRKITSYLGGEVVNAYLTDATSDVKKINLKNGYVMCPNNFILLNPEEAENHEYAGVIECRNSSKYGIPHAMFFCDYRYGREYPKEFCDMMIQKFCEKFEKFKKIVELQVDPIYDPDNPGLLLNSDEWMESPEIGFFAVFVEGDPGYYPNYKPPYGIQIFKKNGLKNKLK